MAKTTAKNSFLCYFKSSMLGVSARNNTDAMDIVVIMFSVYFLMFVLSLLGFRSSDGFVTVNSGLFVIPFFSYVSICAMGLYLRRSPALFNLLPVSYKKRAVYFYLSALLYSLIVAVALLVITIVMSGIIMLIIYMTEGVNAFITDVGDEPAELFVSMGIKGHFLTTCICLLTIGVSTLLALTKSRIKRNILSFVYPIALFIPLFILVNVADRVSGINSNGNIFYGIENLPLSWLWLAIIAVISVGFAVFSVVRLIQHERPKDF